MRVSLAVTAALSAALALAPAASAERTKPNIRFFSGAQDHANWTPKESHDANRMSILFDVGPATSLGYAGLVMNHVEGTPPPEREPSFFHKEDQEGDSKGSPRLVIQFSGAVVDGVPNDISLRPDQWSTSWQKVGEGESGEQGNWDVRGGTCGYRYDVTYEEALGCHEDAIVTGVYMATDSNWQYVDGYRNWIDELQYDSFVFSHARDNNNAPAAE